MKFSLPQARASVACQQGCLPLFRRASGIKALGIQANTSETLIPIVLKDVGILQIKYKSYRWRHMYLRNLKCFPSYSIYCNVMPPGPNSSVLFALCPMQGNTVIYLIWSFSSYPILINPSTLKLPISTLCFIFICSC